MKVAFRIKGDKATYFYPDGPEGVTFKQFIEYLDLVDRNEPKPITVLKTIEQQAAPVIQEAADLIGMADPPRLERMTTMARAIVQGTVKGTAKARKLLPPVLAKLETLDGERQNAFDSYQEPVYFSHIILPYFAKVVSFFTDLPYEKIMGKVDGVAMNVDQLQALYFKCVDSVEYPPPQRDLYGFMLNGIKYMMPAKFMERSTVIEFAEAAQLQAQADKLYHGKWESLVDVCAVICRPHGVPYDEAGYLERKELFKGLSLEIVWQVGFFLLKQSKMLGQDFLIYTAAQALAKLKQEPMNLQASMVGT